MIRGWYTGASGMAAQQNRLDAISNNLANVDTTGYKRDVAVSKSFPELLVRRMNDDGVYLTSVGSADAAPVIGKLGLGVETNELYTILEQGSFKETSHSSDIALQGEGFFAVQTPNGERYTRNGNFMIGKEGILETKEGYPVLGDSGPIHVSGYDFILKEDGRLFTGNDMQFIDRLRIVRFDNERYLQKIGSSLYADTYISGSAYSAEDAERPYVLQNYVETSNVNVVNEMVQMIEVNRAYDANQKTIQSQDSMMTTLWSKVTLLR
ncbi:MAG: flagellar basal-body rod protein FlgF [Bacteroides sp.]|nr:flagellar basal-body rod protein FlgF [Prevotella sp.]MCM1407232.1 flagellar basal-body rod protein FlgF [Treponema brennaborense]MCM1469720.1 flagellar basal-body rod protein FlgF [Bacteroides sp.]